MSRRRTRPTSLLCWQIKQHRYFSWKTHLHVAMTGEYCKGSSRGIRLMKLHNKMMLKVLLMYKITQMFLISLRTITTMTSAKRLTVVLWTYKSWSRRSQRSRTLRTKKKMAPWGITIQTSTHGEDVDAAAADDDYISFVVFDCQKRFLSTMWSCVCYDNWNLMNLLFSILLWEYHLLCMLICVWRLYDN